jgi:hypothetical protein
MNTVPFVLDDLYGGLGRCEGLLRDEGEELCLEFQVKDSLAGILKTRVKEVRIPVKELVSITYKPGWLGIGRPPAWRCWAKFPAPARRGSNCRSRVRTKPPPRNLSRICMFWSEQ